MNPSNTPQSRTGYTVGAAADRRPPERFTKGTVAEIDNAAGMAMVDMDEGGSAPAMVAGAGWLLAGDRVWVQWTMPSSAFVTARLTEEAWRPVGALGSGWTAGTGAVSPRYRRDTSGNVRMEGKLTAAAGAAASIFTLDAGHRPAVGRALTAGAWIVGVGTFAVTINVIAPGVVSLSDPPGLAPTAFVLALGGVSFLAEA